MEPTELKLGKIIELFEAAFESYRILTSPGDKNTDTFHKDWTHLEKRWKVNNWLWHRKHSGSLFFFNFEFKQVLRRIFEVIFLKASLIRYI